MKIKEKSPVLSRSHGHQAKQFHDISVSVQCKRLLDSLRQKGSITTFEARGQLNILHPGGRICELRKLGYLIKIAWVHESENSDGGRPYV